MLAKKNGCEISSHLVLIDQVSGQPLGMTQFLTKAVTPFCSVTIISGKELSAIKKIKKRLSDFTQIKEFVSNAVIGRVFIGNDRSVIGQYFIKEAKKVNPACKACYLDDGVFTYTGRSASKKKSERILDAWFKRKIYGNWYDTPQTVGASKWIDEVWVMFPRHVSPFLKKKKKVEVLSGIDILPLLLPFSEVVLKKTKITSDELQRVDVFITLPNQTVFSKIPSYGQGIVDLVTSLVQRRKRVFIKYHPSARNSDPLGLEELGARCIDSQIGFEVLLPYLKNAHILGDFSTTLLIAQYAGLNMVSTISTDKNSSKSPMSKLCSDLGIETFDLI